MFQWRLRHLKADRKKTGAEIAEAIGCSPNWVYQLANRDSIKTIDTDRLEKLCILFGCEIQDLLVRVK
jgi:DNA-binding Xre family transcriptional regulator